MIVLLMNKNILFYFLSLFILFFSCAHKKTTIKEDLLPSISKKTKIENKISPTKAKPEIKIEKRYDVSMDLYNTRLFFFEKLYQYKKTYHPKENEAILLEAKKLKDKSLRYFLLEKYQKANYYIIEALTLLEE